MPTTLKTIIVCCFLLLLGTLTSPAQVPTDGFFSGAGRFAIGITDKPTSREKKTLSVANYYLYGESIVWRFAEGHYASIDQYHVSGDKPLAKVSPLGQKTVIAGLAKGLVDALAEIGIVTAQIPFTDPPFSGIELRATGAGGKMVGRIFFHRERVYSVIRSGRDRSFEELTAAVKAFRILSQDEYISALIAENTPPPLPQDATGATIVLSDAKRDDLKGNVQSVITEDQEMPKGVRKRWGEAFFDRSGHYVKEIGYLEGYPIDINVWGWIDGMRVYKGATIEYSLTEGPNEERVTMIVGTVDPVAANESQPKRDDRYSNSFTYAATAAGQHTESKMFHNDGTLWQRHSIVYRAGQRETLIYDEEDKLNMRSVEILDATGNVVEERSYDWKGRLESSTVYRYEFDQTGNWTVRKEFKKVRGKVPMAPSSVRYRQISYY